MKMNTMSLAIAVGLAGMAAMQCNSAQTIEELRSRLVNLSEKSNSVIAAIDAEGRSMTQDEDRMLADIQAEFELVTAEIGRREAAQNMAARITAPQNRQAEPPPMPSASPMQPAPSSPMPRITGGEPISATASNGGFQSFGHFLKSLVQAGSRNSGPIDPRLVAIRNAATTYGNEGAGSDGGFAIPPDFRQAIVAKLMGEDSLLSRCDVMQTGSNSVTLPLDETTDYETSLGVRAYWDGEAATMTQTKPSLKELSVRLHKITCLVNVTEELLSDAPAIASHIQSKAPSAINFKVNNAIVNGNGVGQPLGILASAGTVSVAAESGQAADSLLFANLQKAYYRTRAESRKNGVWLIHPDAEERLPFLSFPTSGGTVATPVYLPPGGASQAPYGTLFGRPIIPTEVCPVLGDVGDVIFGDLKMYLAITKIGGIRADTSIHLYFDQDVMAFRFILRVGGQPWRNSTVAGFQAGSNARGMFSTIAERA